MKPIAMLVAIAVGLALPADALARVTIVPPGNSSAGEYADIVPTAGGDRRADSLPPGSGRRGGGASPSTLRKLNALGPTGRAAARFAERTAPTVEQRGAAPQAGAGTRNATRVPPRSVGESQGASPLSAVLKRVFGSSEGGSGLLLPLTLAAVAAAVAAVALLRRRHIS